MNQLKENFGAAEFDSLIIKDKEYSRKKRIKNYLILFAIIIIILCAIIIPTVIIIDNKKYKGGTIICKYKINSSEDRIKILNEEVLKDVKFRINGDLNEIGNSLYKFDHIGV